MNKTDHSKPLDENHSHLKRLRRQAEEAVRGGSVDLSGLTTEDIQHVLHELQVHQVELTMQNEELRRIQSEMEISRDLYSGLYNNAPVGYCTLDRKDHILEANQTLAAMLGVDQRRLIRIPFTKFVERGDQDTYYLHRQRCFEDQSQTQVSDIRLAGQNGEPFIVRMESKMMPGNENQVRVVISDITDRKQAEEALREAQNRLEIALKNSALSVYTMDHELRYTWIYNPQHGFSPEGVLGKRDDELIPAEQAAEVMTLKREVLESGIGQHREVRVRIREENLVHDVSIEPIRGDHGEVIGLTGASMDITSQRRMEKEAAETAAQRSVQHRLIDQREKERQEIARDLHDGPIQELIGITYLLQDLRNKGLDGSGADELQAIQATIQAQISELRAFASELRPPVLAAFGLEKGIRSQIEALREKHPEITIHFNAFQEGGLLSEVDKLVLFRIFQQAINNMMKHAQATEVSVRFEKDVHEARLMIQDNGRGFKLPESLLDLAKDGHLGLVGMEERAEAVGGKLEVTSEPGQGTTIRVTIPIEEERSRP